MPLVEFMKRARPKSAIFTKPLLLNSKLAAKEFKNIKKGKNTFKVSVHNIKIMHVGYAFEYLFDDTFDLGWCKLVMF